MRPRRSGGFCRRLIAWLGRFAPVFQLRPRRSGGFCHPRGSGQPLVGTVSIAAPPERGILLARPSHLSMFSGGFNCGPAGAGDFALIVGVVSHHLAVFQLRPRRSGGFCVRWVAANRADGISFNCGPAGAGDFACTDSKKAATEIFVSIAAPPERGILLLTLFILVLALKLFQLRPRRSGGFCGLESTPHPARSEGCFNCGPAGAGDFAPYRVSYCSLLKMFQLRPRRSGGFCRQPVGGLRGR